MQKQERLTAKLLQEYQTIEAMVVLYCKANHQSTQVPCDSCNEFLSYAHTRLDRCPYGQAKPTCNKCPVHCYKPELKARAKEIMRYAGPRMLLSHPIMAIRHLVAEQMPKAGKPPAASSNRHLRKAAKK